MEKKRRTDDSLKPSEKTEGRIQGNPNKSIKLDDRKFNRRKNNGRCVMCGKPKHDQCSDELAAQSSAIGVV